MIISFSIAHIHKTFKSTVFRRTQLVLNALYFISDILLSQKQKQKEAIADHSSHWCQPFLTAVAECAKSPMGKNALRQTFGPAIRKLYGTDLGYAILVMPGPLFV